MASFLVYYATGEGQTGKIAERIVETLTARGHEAMAVDAAEVSDPALDAYDAVLIGASIHGGRHQESVVEFVREHREALAALPTAFFQVSMSAASASKAADAATYLETFLSETGWNPDRIAQFGGALRFSEMGFLKRLLIKQVVRRNNPDLDISGDGEWTDWDAVENFANDVAAFVEGRLGVPAPDVTSDSA
jgi:menaquinone-dependent protoporphyrinogen oxidase